MKTLIIHASAGAGHRMAAQAIYDGLDHQATLVDALDYTSPSFKVLYTKTYTYLITYCRWFWGIIFWLLDVPWLQGPIRAFRRVYNTINANKLQKFLEKEQFDVIISTHFMPTEVSCALKRKGTIKSKIITVITDYDVHRIWIAKGNDMFAVGSDWTKRKIENIGIDSFRVFATGIPTNEKFSRNYDISNLKERFELKEDVFTVLVATGSFGIGPIEAIIKALKGFQVIVVCGHNKKLYAKLIAHKTDLVKVFGLVDNMHELMAVSDIMVTKPGGLSISEALVSQLPMVFFNAIPGQESNNVKVLKKHGVGVSGLDINGIVSVLQRYQSSRDTYLTALKKTRALAKPSAVKDIISLIN
ncbi:MAG: hypothetical protein KC684_03980 [Candidatus Omnitrophica bacterium]|nr:hypothetical protein [Candidatus Omnitrophota bacterium]